MFLVCRKMYEEACPVFFDESPFCLGGSVQLALATRVDELICFAKNILPSTKPHIRNLRNVNFIATNQQAFAWFPNLWTVSINPWPIILPPALLSHLNNMMMLDLNLRRLASAVSHYAQMMEWLKSNNIDIVK